MISIVSNSQVHSRNVNIRTNEVKYRGRELVSEKSCWNVNIPDYWSLDKRELTVLGMWSTPGQSTAKSLSMFQIAMMKINRWYHYTNWPCCKFASVHAELYCPLSLFNICAVIPMIIKINSLLHKCHRHFSYYVFFNDFMIRNLPGKHIGLLHELNEHEHIPVY